MTLMHPCKPNKIQVGRRLRCASWRSARLFVGLIGTLTATAAFAADWPADKLGAQKAWDAAYDASSGMRFIPFQLIVPGVWSGERRIELPSAVSFTDPDGDRWSGPVEEIDAATGKSIAAFTRIRSNKREGTVTQRFAVRAEQDGIGRVYDSRFGEIACSGEVKFPLGEWRQGERMRNDYSCAAKGKPPMDRFNIITIEKVDFPCHGVQHCLQFTWTHYMEGQDKPLDDRRYTFVPGLGEVGHERR